MYNCTKSERDFQKVIYSIATSQENSHDVV